MADFYLIRHGHNDYLGHALAGRLPAVSLNAKGRAEAEQIANALAAKGIQRIISSPLERCRETAEPLARKLQKEIEIFDDVLEVDFGDWTGKSMKELEALQGWKYFNTYRSGTQIPNGETMLRIQARMVGFVQKLQREDPRQTVAIFSHGDPLRSVLTYFLGMPLDMLIRMEVSPGSYSLLRLEEWGPQILCVNRLPD